MKIKKRFLVFFSEVNKHRLRLLPPTVIDIAGFVLASIVYSFFFLKIHPYLVELVNIIGPLMGQELASVSSQGELTALAGSVMRLQTTFNTVTSLLLYLALSLFVIWLISQLFSWFLVKKIVKPIGFWRYARDFSIVSVVAFIVFLIFVKSVFKFTYVWGVTKGNVIEPRTVSIILLSGLVVLFYLGIVFYLNCGERKMLIKSLKRLIQIKMIFAFAGSAILVCVIGWILYKLTVLLSLITGSAIALFAPVYLLIFPILTLIKFYLHKIQ